MAVTPRIVGCALYAGLDEAALGRARARTGALLGRFPWLTRHVAEAGGTTIEVWGHGAVAEAVSADAGGLTFAVGAELPADRLPRVNAAIDGSGWEGAGAPEGELGRALVVRVAGDGTWTAWTDWTGSIGLYHGVRGAGRVAATAEPVAVAALALGPADCAPEGIAALLNHGFFLGTGTLLRGLSVTPPDAAARWTGAGAEVRRRGTVGPSDARWESGWNDLVDEAAELFSSVLEEAVRARPEWTLPLSGGMDSRLIAAAVRATGTRAEAVTYGPADWPDAIYARQAARKLGLPWRRIEFGDRYLSDHTRLWADMFGSALHFHGMYQMPFIEAVARGPAIVTGFTGDPLGGAQTELMMKPGLTPRGRLLAKWQAWSPDEVVELLGPPALDALSALDADAQAQWDAFEGADHQRAWQLFQANHVARFSTYQPTMYDYASAVSCPFVDRRLANFALSLPRAALDGRRLQLDVLRRHFRDLAVVGATYQPEPLLVPRAYILRRLLAQRLPERLRLGSLKEFATVENTADSDAIARHGDAALWPLGEAGGVLDDVLASAAPLARARAAAEAGDVYAVTKLGAVQALAYRLLDGPAAP